MLDFEVAMLNERGGRQVNEDACGYWRSDDRLCCVMADGAGGHGGGREAARFAVRHLLESLSRRPSHDSGELALRVREANTALRESRVQGTALADMFSTVACLVLDRTSLRAHWAHAGDTRIYWFRNGRMAARTRDHSVVQEMADQGRLAPGDLRSHPRRSELLCALGSAEGDLRVGEGSLESVTPGQDAFLLCTDGLWEHTDDTVLESTLSQATGPQAWLQSLGAIVGEVARHRPRHDNFTALAAWAVSPGIPAGQAD